MKGKLYIVLCLAVAAALAVIATSHKVSAFSGSGSGTAGDPYVITTVTQLQEMNNDLAAYYVLGNDIDASATTGWNGGMGFVPIGSGDNLFIGSFYGHGHTISNLYIHRPSVDYLGLFGFIDSAGVVENVGLNNGDVYGSHSSYVGILAGRNRGEISHCYSTGSVTDYINGVNVGGLVGELNGTLSYSYSTATVSGWDDTGGLAGVADVSATISYCYSTGAVDGRPATGGLVGYNYGSVENSYSTSSVGSGFGDDKGGLIGTNSGNVSNCYATGVVSGSTSYLGGLIASSVGGVSNSFWDNQTSGQSTSAGGTGKTTDNMKNVRTYTDATWSTGLTSPWDFAGNPYGDIENIDLWNIDNTHNNGYPFFWQPPVPPNEPTNISPSTRQITTNVTISCRITDNNGDNIRVFFYDNATKNQIDNVIIASGGIAQVTWNGRTRGQAYTFFARGQDNTGWGDNSDTQSFRVNALPTTPALTLANPKVGQVLTATASGSTDNDNDNLTYYYRFYNQTMGIERQAYSTTNTYTIQLADAHDNIRVYTKAYDNYEYSSENENSIIVSNSLPVVGLVSPDNGATGTSLTPLLDWSFADNDSDTQVKYWVVVDNDNNFSSPIENTGQVTSSATIYAVPAPLAYSTKYYWEVNVYDNYEWSGWYGSWNFTTGSNPNFPPNKPTNLLPSVRQTTTNVALSCIVVDNDVNPINVFFYDNLDNILIDNIWIASGGTAHVTWVSRIRGQNYAFFTRGQDNNGAWGDNSDVQSFKVNLVPTCSISLSTSTPEAGQTVLFMANALDSDNDNLTYHWDLGDGSTSTLANPSHSYSAGNYTVTLYVNDGYENSTTDNVAITVHTPPTPTGGGPSWVPAPINKVVKPYENVLFRSITMIGPFSFNLFWALVIVIILAWRYEKGGKGHIKGIMWSSLLLLGFLFIFGSGLGIL